MKRGTTETQMIEYTHNAKLDMQLGAKQWKEMLAKSKKSFQKISRDKENKYPRRNCIATILDHVGHEFIPPAFATATLLASCTAVPGSPLCNTDKLSNGIEHADIVCAYGTKATYQKVTNADNPVMACMDLFNVIEDAMRVNYLLGLDFENPKEASIYQAVDLVMQRARNAGTTAEEFATWSLVIISDRSFSETEELKSTWHMGELPYLKLRARIDKGGFGGKAGYPKFIFFRESDDFEEEYMNGIPVQSDIIPGVILMSGDSANVIDEIIEAFFSP